ncbi:hypothetical protein R50073_02330 [Maricurvus nonylphenolicus]|uniref:peptidylprolyl isomerase n=1 Tax=Maricurvus nonylphenolicus TaxID=1008307 RepID=UPI0036F36C4A
MSKVDIKSNTYLRKWRIGLAVIVLLASLIVGGVEQSWWVSEEGALVMVNQRPVTRDHVVQVLNNTQSISHRELSPEEHQRLLQLLVDEELMLQHIEAQGSLSAEPRLRKDLVHRVIDDVVKQFLAKPVSEDELRAFYRDHQAVFQRSKAAAIIVFRVETPDHAETISQAIASTSYQRASQLHAEHIVNHIPNSLMPASGLRRYLGPSLTQVAMSLHAGQLSEPQITDEGVYLFYATRVKASYQPAYEEVAEDVRAEYYRRGRDLALGALLSRLRARADIRINSALHELNDPRGGGV